MTEYKRKYCVVESNIRWYNCYYYKVQITPTGIKNFMKTYSVLTNSSVTSRSFRNTVRKRFGCRVRRESSRCVNVYISNTEFLDILLSQAEIFNEILSFENSSALFMAELEKLDGYDFRLRFVKTPTSPYEIELNPFRGNIRSHDNRMAWKNDLNEFVENNTGISIKRERSWYGVTLKVCDLEMVGLIALHESDTIEKITKLVQKV